MARREQETQLFKTQSACRAFWPDRPERTSVDRPTPTISIGTALLKATTIGLVGLTVDRRSCADERKAEENNNKKPSRFFLLVDWVFGRSTSSYKTLNVKSWNRWDAIDNTHTLVSRCYPSSVVEELLSRRTLNRAIKPIFFFSVGNKSCHLM